MELMGFKLNQLWVRQKGVYRCIENKSLLKQILFPNNIMQAFALRKSFKHKFDIKIHH